MKNKEMNNIVIDEDKDELSLKLKENIEYRLDCKGKKIVNVNVLENSSVSLTEINDSKNVSRTYNYYVYDNSNLVINRFYDLENVREKINIYLNGYGSNVVLNLSAISKGTHSYIVNVYHNNKNTTSNTNIHGVTFSSNKIDIENNGYIKKGCSLSTLNQDNKIIALDENNSVIKPNLFIDEFDVEASHGAYIGKFTDEDLFYLKSRGLNEKDSYNLLIKGFLLNEFNINDEEKEEVKNIISKYWR